MNPNVKMVLVHRYDAEPPLRVPARRAWTDYPFAELGDTPGEKAPIRECWVSCYNGDKYVTLHIGDIQLSIKRWYVYRKPGRCGDGRTIDVLLLHDFYGKPWWKRKKRWGRRRTYDVYSDSYTNDHFEIGSLDEVMRIIHKHKVNTGETSMVRVNERTWGGATAYKSSSKFFGSNEPLPITYRGKTWHTRRKNSASPK